jgi:hypothetical protein
MKGYIPILHQEHRLHLGWRGGEGGRGREEADNGELYALTLTVPICRYEENISGENK